LTASVDVAINEVLGKAKEAGMKYSKLINTPAPFQLLTCMLQMSTHFCPMRYVKVNIINGWIGTSSGVSATFCDV
jgi:hypothetical protein